MKCSLHCPTTIRDAPEGFTRCDRVSALNYFLDQIINRWIKAELARLTPTRSRPLPVCRAPPVGVLPFAIVSVRKLRLGAAIPATSHLLGTCAKVSFSILQELACGSRAII